jgi:hypothetical protein
MYFEPGKHVREKPIKAACTAEGCISPDKEMWCNICNEIIKKNDVVWKYRFGSDTPLSYCTKGHDVFLRIISSFKPPEEIIKPFWKDEIRARWRDNWSAAFILEYNSVVRAIDRTFGLPEGADISGTTADSIFGMESVLYLQAQGKTISTQRESVELDDRGWSMKYPGVVILLPLITMVKHGHHALLECALTFMLTGYIDAYHIGKYTSLWPKGSAQSGPIWDLLKEYEDSPANMRIIIERNEKGFVTGGWLFSKNDTLGKYTFQDITKINYQRYINIFLSLRDSMRDKSIINREYIISLMDYSEKKIDDLMYQMIEETAERLSGDDRNEKECDSFLKELEKYCRKETDDNVKQKLEKIYDNYRGHVRV